MDDQHPAGLDGPVSDLLLRTRKLLRPHKVSDDLRTITHEGGREGDVFYRDRWSHDKVVRATHGVNCTRYWLGSPLWMIPEHCQCRKLGPCSSSGVFVFVEDAAEAIAPSYVEASYLVQICDRRRQWMQRAGVRDALLRTRPDEIIGKGRAP